MLDKTKIKWSKSHFLEERQIISNEGGREKLEVSIKAEIQKINNNKDNVSCCDNTI